MKIKIYTYPDKRPEHFLKDNDYELIINNGSTQELRSEIEDISIKNKLIENE